MHKCRVEVCDQFVSDDGCPVEDHLHVRCLGCEYQHFDMCDDWVEPINWHEVANARKED